MKRPTNQQGALAPIRLLFVGPGLFIAVMLRVLALFLVATGSANAADSEASRLTIEKAIAQAVRNHPGIAAAHAEQKAAQAEVSAARGQYWPTPSIQLIQHKGESATVLTVQQPLWAGGRLDAGLAAAESRADSAQVSITDTQYALALRVTSAWAVWMQSRGRAEALAGGVELLTVYAQSVGRRIVSGASAEVDRELVAARLAQMQGDLAAARSAERSALARLAQLVGQPLRSADMDTTLASATSAESPSPNLDTLLAQAMASSAALRRLEADIEAAGHEAQAKRAALWPALSLRAQHQRGNSAATGIAANDSRIMLALEYTPGAGLSASAQVDAAEARRIGLRETLEAARRDLADKVATDYEELVSSHERRRQLQRTIDASAEVLASYDRLFIAGKRSWLDVINAARELVQARTALADIEAQRMAARTRLRLHTGELF